VEAALCLAYLRPLKLDKAAWIKSFFAVFLYSVPALWFNLVFKQGTYGVYIGQGLYSADTPGLSELLYVLYLLFNRMIFTYLLAGICILALFQALRPMRGLSFSQWGGRARDWSVSHPAAVTVSAAALLPFAALFFFKAGEISLFVHCTRYVLVSWSLLCFFPAVALAAVRIPAKRLLFGLLALWSVAHAFQLQSHNKGIWYSQYLDKDEESALILADWKDTDLLATPIQGMAYYLDLFTRLKVPLAVITDREYMARNYALRFATHNFIEKELVFSPEDIPAGRRMWVLVCGESFSDPSWRWILTSPGLSILKSYSRKKTQLYLIERK
jgi:hypothetical protein